MLISSTGGYAMEVNPQYHRVAVVLVLRPILSSAERHFHFHFGAEWLAKI